MYKSELANHPWRKLRDRAAYAKTYQRVGRDLKIGQLWVMLVIAIMLTTTIVGGIAATAFYQLPVYQLPVNGMLAELLGNLSYQRIVIGCTLAAVGYIFLYLGSKYVYRLLVWQLVPLALVGLGMVAYLCSTPETLLLGILTAIAFSPYFLCAGILTLSWRAKLYLAYMNGEV